MSTTLRYGMRSSEVLDLQKRLNCASATRLPVLVATPSDSKFGVFTKARVMEFQSLNGLTVDGIAGKGTQGKLSTVPANCTKTVTPKGKCILVDLINNKLIAFKDGQEEHRISPIRGGSASDPSTQGVFPMSDRRLRSHTSSQFPFPPGNMDFSLFYHRGEAIHQGPPTSPSHGCIHVGAPYAETLFDWAGKSSILVIVVKS